MTTAELLALWQTRDARYRTRRQSLTDREAECIRDYRRTETRLVHGSAVGALTALSQWTPPK